MSFWGVLLSLIVHVGGMSLFLLENSVLSPKKTVDLQETAPCTIPLEVTAVSDISCAPISRPKINGEQSAEDPEKTVIEHLLEEPKPEQKPHPEPEIKPDPVPNIPETPAPEPDPVPIPDFLAEPEPAPQPEPKNLPEPKVEPIPEPIPTIQKKNKPKAKVKPVLKTKPVLKEHTKSKSVAKSEKSVKPVKKNPSVDPIFEILKQHEKEMKKNKPKKPKPSNFVSVLKNVDKNQKRGPTGETPITDPNSDSDYGAPAIGPQMAMSVIDRVRRLLENAWRVPLRANEGGSLIVMVCMDMNHDGTVRNAHIDHQRGTPAHPAYRVACDSALRAVDEFRLNPLPLPQENYDQWKSFEFRFIRK